ncbi:MFS transporter [SAR202 cluster bacterium AC-647-N09_OGT_505m]|nr:MFS transporter [SAR202 cluster bacterium AC-647-N09_OGT_505m]
MLKSKPKFFYGYWVLSAGSLVMMLLGIAGLHGLGVFFSALQRDYHWSSALLSGAFALSRAESGFLGPVEGYLVDRVGPRKMVAIGLTILGVGFILLSRVDSLVSFYIALVIIALGTGLGGFLAIMASLTNWFHRLRARAMAVATVGVNVGGLLVVVLTWGVDNYGWRASALVFALIVFAMIPPITKVLRNNPEDYGLLPDGVETTNLSHQCPSSPLSGEILAGFQGSATQDAPRDDDEDMTVRDALHSQAFWMISLVHGIAVMALSALAVHQIERMVQAGISLQAAGLVVTIYTGVGIFFRVFSGYIADIFDKRYVISGFLLFQTFALFVFAVGNNMLMFVFFGLLFAPGWSGRGAALTSFRGELFGRKRFASITGASMVITNSLSLIGPVFTGLLFDATGSYLSPFLILSALSLLAAFLILLVQKPKPRTREATDS